MARPEDTSRRPSSVHRDRGRWRGRRRIVQRRERGRPPSRSRSPGCPFRPDAAESRRSSRCSSRKGLVDPAALDALIDTYEHKVGPAQRRARRRARLGRSRLQAAAARPTRPPPSPNSDISSGQGEHMIVVENTPEGPQPDRLHAVLLLSVAGAGTAAGLVQVRALSLARGDRSARHAAASSALELAEDVEVRVWDSTAELRYLVLPERPAGTEALTEDELAALVTRDAMVGVAQGDADATGGSP